MSNHSVWTLGVSGSFHDSSAVLLRDGKLIAALEEERVTRTKHDGSPFPVHAILRILAQANICWSDIEDIAVAWDFSQYKTDNAREAPAESFFANLHQKYASENGIAVHDVQRRNVLERNIARFKRSAVDNFLERMLFETNSNHLPVVHFIRHHLAHAASAYYCSGFQERTLVITLDGYGDTETTTVWIGHEGDLTSIAKTLIPHSLGWVYSSVTEYLGFTPVFSEGEVMGLAPFGAPRNSRELALAESLEKFMKDFVRFEKKGGFQVNAEYLYFGEFPTGYTRVSQTMMDALRHLVPPTEKTQTSIDPETEQDRPKAILAWALQNRIEEALLHLVKYYLRDDIRTRGINAVAMAGGVAYNIKANSRLIADGIVQTDRLFVHPAAGDAGTAWGAAMVLARTKYGLKPEHSIRRTDFGPKYRDDEIIAALGSAGLKAGRDYIVFEDEDSIARHVAELLSNNRAVAWFQGGSEFGPRALGSRSILLNPKDPHSDAIANSAKQREYWRPVAIAIAIEDAQSFVEGLDAEAESPLMTLSFELRQSRQSLFKSGCHRADKTTRLQTVAQDQNPLLWKVLHRLGELTGLPAATNTSFNRNEPLVETPEEALNTFAYMREIDVMAIGRFLVTSRENISPSICSLRENSTGKALLDLTKTKGFSLNRDLFLTLTNGTKAGHQIIISLRDRGDNTYYLNCPLVKEFFDARAGADVRRIIGSEIARKIIEHDALSVSIESTSAKYNNIVFDALCAAIQTARSAVVGYDQGSKVSFTRIAPTKIPPQNTSA